MMRHDLKRAVQIIDQQLDIINTALRDLNPPPHRINWVISAVAEEYGIESPQITGRSQRKKFLFPRYLAIYLVDQIGVYSIIDIGRFFNRDHTTIIHARRRALEIMEIDPRYRETADRISKLYREKFSA